MQNYHHSVAINAPPEVVWQRMLDEIVFGMAKHNVQTTPPGEIVRGTLFTGSVRLLGRSATIACRVSELEYAQRLRVELDPVLSNIHYQPKAASLDVTMMTHPSLEEKVRLQADLLIEPPASRLARVALAPLGHVVGHRLEQGLVHLREELEGSNRL